MIILGVMVLKKAQFMPAMIALSSPNGFFIMPDAHDTNIAIAFVIKPQALT